MRALLFALGTTAVLGTTTLACNSTPYVVPFPDAGDPCGTPMNIDCGEFANKTCTVPGDGGCARVVYGCADAAFFVDADTSQCPADSGSAGSDGPAVGDGGLIHTTDGGRDAADARGGDAADGAAE